MAAKKIKSAKRIALVSHINPDGDTIGCLLAMAHGLKGMGKTLILLNADGVPERCQSFAGWKRIKTEFSGKVDLAISVDCGAPKRVGKFSALFDAAPDSLQIDHHDFGEGFCHAGLIDHKASATAEIVYDLLKHMKIKLTKTIGHCLLSAIISDTVSFHTSSTTPRTMRISADLLELGLNMEVVSNEAFWKRSMAEIKLSAVSMNRLEFEQDGQVAWSYVTQKDFKKYEGKMSDVEEVPSELMGVRGVKIAVYMREMREMREVGGNKYRVSLRAMSPINVARVAQQFNGGGHAQAAGCNIAATPAARRDLMKAICALVK